MPGNFLVKNCQEFARINVNGLFNIPLNVAIDLLSSASPKKLFNLKNSIRCSCFKSTIASPNKTSQTKPTAIFYEYLINDNFYSE